MYSRSINEKFTIRSDDEKKSIIACINNQLFKQSLFKCINLVTAIGPNDEILLRGLVCRNDTSKQIQIFNVSGNFPGLRVQNLDGTIVGTVIFEENQFSTTSRKDDFVEEIVITPTVNEEVSSQDNPEETESVVSETIESEESPSEPIEPTDVIESTETEEVKTKTDIINNDEHELKGDVSNNKPDEEKPSNVSSAEKQSTPRKRGRRKKV